MNIKTEMPVEIRLLGTFEVERGDRQIKAQDWSRKKAAALLKRLALEHRLLKDQAIDFLWPGSNSHSGSNNLYRVLYSLRQTLDESFGRGKAEQIFSFEDGVLHLDDSVWVDASEFERLCRPVLGETPEQQIARITEALAVYRGDFLPDDLYEEWTQLPRETLGRRRREVCLILSRNYLEHGKYAAVPGLLSPLLAFDLADEPVQREVIQAYALSGRRHEALRQYQALVDALASELDVPPSPETTALYDQILHGGLAQMTEPSPRVGRSLPTPVNLNSEKFSLFVGRQPDLEALGEVLKEAGQGQGATILIAGETGIGKTRIAIEALHMGSSQGMTVLMGAAYEQEGRMPFQPFIEAFDHYLAEKGRSLKENPITHFQRLGASDLQQEQWALFKATENFIQEIAKDAPLVFLVDDLHAADETSLQLFHYLARHTRASPVVFIATHRIDAPTSTQFNALLNALYQEGLSRTFSLQSLPRLATDEILEAVLEGEVSDELGQAVYDITTGNPFFTQEIARALIRQEKGVMVGDVWSLKIGEILSVPEDLGALLRQKVSRLGSGVEAVLSAAAVIGSEFRFEVLQGMSGSSLFERDNLSTGKILEALDLSLTGYLIEETPVGYRFRHPLIRRTLYESLNRVRRANLHTRTAEAIERIYMSRSDGQKQQIEMLAYHYDLSDRRDRALAYLIQAGENAAGVYAFEVGVDYYERALSLMDVLDVQDRALRWRLLESLGRWYGILANTPLAVERFEQALGLDTESDWYPANRDRVRLHCLTAVALITAGEMDNAERHLQTALLLIDEHEEAPEYADLLYNLAQLHWHRNEFHQALELAQRCLEISERLNQPEAVARAFEMLALACHSLGEWRAGIAYEQQRAELAGTSLDVTDAFDVHL